MSHAQTVALTIPRPRISARQSSLLAQCAAHARQAASGYEARSYGILADWGLAECINGVWHASDDGRRWIGDTK